ncbi:MAG: carbohydrate diacid regulator [Clostridiales bacterium]|nr:carbohydrate diacid regulator [Clostridiales bacterium]
MLTNKQMQQLVEDAAFNLSIPISLIETGGNILASSRKDQIKAIDDIVQAEADVIAKAGFMVKDGVSYYAVSLSNYKPLYIRMDGQGEVVRRYCYLFKALLELYDKMPEQHLTKEQFVHRLLLDQVPPADVPVYLDDFRVERKLKRCVYLIMADDKEDEVYSVLSKAFPRSHKDIIIRMDTKNIVLVKVIEDEEDETTTADDLIQMGLAISESILNELSVNVIVGVGSIKDDIMQIRQSYIEAQKAIDIGRAFDNGKKGLYVYDKLFIEKLLFNISPEKCQEFYDRVFKGEEFDFLNEAMIQTVQKLFENSLNLSETSRQLYIHRNTLVYRLDKIQKYTALDLRNFDDAVTFKLGLMIGRYLGYIKN